MEETKKINENSKITFEDIQKANKTIKTTDIKGKAYCEVNQRLKAYRMLYPNGSIETEMISNENGICVFRAYVYDENKNLLATGTAYEKESSSFINKTSYIENCETSALGRALGMCGFGIDTSIASADEVNNAIANQSTQNNNEKLQLMVQLNHLVQVKKVDYEKLLEFYKVSSNVDMTVEQLKEAINTLESREDK